MPTLHLAVCVTRAAVDPRTSDGLNGKQIGVNNSCRSFARFVSVLLLMFGAVFPVFAQNASSCGKVTDPRGNVIAGAQIQVVNQDAASKIAAARTDRKLATYGYLS